DLIEMMELVRSRRMPYALRTTVICGLPGETNKDHAAMRQFLKRHPFDMLGAFAYSREKGTPAYDMPDQVPEPIKQSRLKEIMLQQQRISRARGKARVGERVRVLVEGQEQDSGLFYGRSMWEAPETDGKIFFTAKGQPAPGEFVWVELTGSDIYDWVGDECDGNCQ
nr:30S ribosomal protein S12 methylthiotransferase RimO [bacterium]